MNNMLRSLQVTASLDPGKYNAGAKSMADSAKMLGTELARIDAHLNNSNPAEKFASALAKQSRSFVEGYRDASRYESELGKINSMLSRGLPVDRAIQQLTSLSDRFGTTASRADALKHQYVALIPVIDVVNARLADTRGISAVNTELERRATLSQQAAQSLTQIRSALDPAIAAELKFAAAVRDADAALGMHGNIGVYRQQIAALRSEWQAAGARPMPGGSSVDPNALIGARLSGGSAQSSAAAFREAAQEQERMAAAAKLLRLEIDPLGSAQSRLNAELAEYNALSAAGAITTGELALANNAANQRFLRSVELQKHVGTSLRLNRHEMANLSYQFNDMAVMLASGQSPFMMLMQQGMQVGQTFTGMKLGEAVKTLGAGILSFVLNPINLAVVGFAALAGGAAYFISNWKSSGPTVEENLKRMAELSDDLAKALGSAGENMGKLAVGSKNVIEFQARINVDKTIASLQKELRGAIKGAGSGMLGGIGQLNPQELALMPPGMMKDSGFEHLLPVMRQILDMKSPSIDVIKGFQEELVRLANTFPDSKKGAVELLIALDPLADGVRRVEARIRDLDAATQRFRRSQAIIGPVLNEITGARPELKSPRELLDENYGKGVNAATSYGQVQQLTEEYRKTLEYLNREVRKSADLHQLDLEAMDAKSPKQLAEIAAFRAKTNAVNTAVSATQGDIDAMRAYELAFKSATKAIEDQAKARLDAANDNVASLQKEVEWIGKSAAEVALLRDNWKLESEMRREAGANGVAVDEAQLARLKALNAEAAKLNQTMAVANLRKDLATEQRLSMMAPGEADVFKRLQGAGIQEGTAAWHELAEAIRAANREQNSFGFGLRQGFNDMVTHVNDFAASGKQIFDDFFGGVEEQWVKFAQTGKFSFKDMVNTIIGDVSRLAYRMTMTGLLGLLGVGSTGQGGLFNQGGAQGGGGNVLGTVLGSMFGSSASAAPSQQGGVTPGSVSGGIGGLGALLKIPGLLFGNSSSTPGYGPATSRAVARELGLGTPGLISTATGAATSAYNGLGGLGSLLTAMIPGAPMVANWWGGGSRGGPQAVPVPVTAGPKGPNFSSSATDYLRSTFFDAAPKNPFAGGFSFSMPTFGDSEGGGIGGILSSMVSPFMSLFGGGKSKAAAGASDIGAGLSSPMIARLQAANSNIPGLGIQPGLSAGGMYGSGPLLNMIGRYEGTDRGRGYNETLDYGRWTGGNRNLTSMTLDQVYDLGLSMRTPANRALYGEGKGSSALGRYQIVGGTMRNLQKQMGLKGDELFDPAMQDRMAMQLAMGRGPNAAGLGKEWVGLQKAPQADLLSAYREQMGRFSGDGMAKAGFGAEQAEAFQLRMKQAQEALAANAGELAATAHRFTNELNTSLTTITSGAQSAGSGFGGALGSALSGILSQVGGTGGGLLGTLLSSVMSMFAKGGSFSGVTAFATGSPFANSVYSRPTMFRYGGSNLGVMGEAGPEAVMPLINGSGGLAVRAFIRALGRETALPLTRTPSGHLGVAIDAANDDGPWWTKLDNSPSANPADKKANPELLTHDLGRYVTTKGGKSWAADLSPNRGSNRGKYDNNKYAYGGVFGVANRAQMDWSFNRSSGAKSSRISRSEPDGSGAPTKVVNFVQNNSFTAPKMNEMLRSQNQMAARQMQSGRRMSRTT